MSETAIRYDFGQESVTAGVAAHIERPAVEGSPLQHPSDLSGEQLAQAYVEEINTYLQAHAVQESSPRVETLISPEHTKRHHDLVDQILPDFKTTHDAESSYQILGQAIEIGREVVERPLDSRSASERFAEALADTSEKASESDLLVLMKETIKTEGTAYSIGRSLAEKPELAESLTAHVNAKDASGWDKAALYVCLDAAVTSRKSKHSESSLWWSPPGDKAEPVGAQFDETDVVLAALERSKAEVAMRRPSGEIPVYQVTKLIEQYSGQAEAGVSADIAMTFDNIQPTSGYRESSQDIDPTDIIETVEAYRRASPEMVEIVHSGNHDPQKLLALEPLIGRLSKGPEDFKPDKARILELASLTGTSVFVEKGEADTRRKTLETLVDHGVPLESLIDLVRTPKNADLLTECLEASLKDDNAQISKDLLIKMLNLPLYSEKNADQTDYYANGQGHDPDVRDSILRTIIQNPNSVKDHVEMLSQKIPGLIESGFPLDLIAKSILTEFNPSVGVNISDKSFYEKKIDYCVAIGDSIASIKNFDTELADWIIDGQYHDIVNGDAIPDIASIKQLGIELSGISREGSPVEAWLKEFSRPDVSSVDKLTRLVGIGQRFAADPDLNKIAFAKFPGSSMATPESNSLRASAAKLSSFEAVEQYFTNCDIVRPALRNEKLSHYDILQNIATLDSAGAELLVGQLTSETVLKALEDPQMRLKIARTLNLVSLYPDTTNLERGLTIFDQIKNKEYFELSQIIYGAHIVVDQLPPGFDELFYSAIERVAGSTDKDGNPYESILTINGVFKHLVPSKNVDLFQQDKAKELLKWYEQSSMPYVAMPSILTMRDQAVQAGVPDSPRDIYEWMFSSQERIAEMSAKHLTDYVSKIRLKPGQEHDLTGAKEEAASRKDNFAVFVNVTELALNKIITESDGRIKTMLDRVVTTNRGPEYGLSRSEVEIGLGLRSMDETIEHPIYGSCGFLDDKIPAGAVGYGQILMTFPMNDDLESRTTFTPEDSFHGVTRLTALDAATVRILKDRQDIGYTLTSDYVESQISGGLTIDEASQIIVPDEEYRIRLLTSLPEKYHSKIMVRPYQVQRITSLDVGF